MEIKPVQNQNEWDNALKKFQGVPFTQSFEWGEILENEGRSVDKLVVQENNVAKLAAQVVYSKLFLGKKYAFCPKGPVGELGLENEELRILSEYLKEKGCVFLRVEPDSKFQIPNSRFVKTVDVNPRATTILDLDKTEDQLLAGMHQKTRYNIRLSQKKGLTVSTQKNWDWFWNLMKETGERDGFRLHGKKHYEAILNSDFTKQFTALANGEPTAVVIGVGYGDVFTYVFGASNYKYREMMAPHLLQYEAIKFAKGAGYKYYDFFGIAPKLESRIKDQESSEYEYDRNHQYAGVTRFKLGFGGKVVEKPGTYDLIISSVWYRLYGLLRKIRRLV